MAHLGTCSEGGSRPLAGKVMIGWLSEHLLALLSANVPVTNFQKSGAVVGEAGDMRNINAESSMEGSF